MDNKNSIKIFEDKKVRTLWDEEKEQWFVSIIDVIEVLTESVNPTPSLSNFSAHNAASFTPPMVVSAITHCTSEPSGYLNVSS